MANRFPSAADYPNDETIKEILLIYEMYPYLVPFNNYKKWEGIIYHEGTRFNLVINTPNYPSLQNHKLFCSHGISPDTQNLRSDSLLDFLDDVKACIVSEESKENSLEIQPSLETLKSLAQIVSDVDRYVGRNNVESVDERRSWVRLKYTDSSDCDNFIKVALDAGYPESVLRILDVDLPEDVLPQFGQIKRLGDLYTCFKETVESLTPFWRITRVLADEAWVIEPLEPTRKDLHRRIFLSDNLSVQLLFNPLNVDSMPDIKFLGSLGAVSQARDTYQRNLQETGWWSDSSVVENLCHLLNLDSLPKKTSATLHSQVSHDVEDAQSNECAICYETSADGETLPAKWCSNKNCSGRFHHVCLMEWLNSVATSKTSFDHISGPCPHCDEKIFCPIKLK